MSSETPFPSDAQVQAAALKYIQQHAMDVAGWRWTRLGQTHFENDHLDLADGELPIVSFFESENSWYVLTTRRVIVGSAGHPSRVSPFEVVDTRFGDFKGITTRKETEHAALTLADGEMRMPYETGRASMAPIYYFRFWRIKYPRVERRARIGA